MKSSMKLTSSAGMKTKAVKSKRIAWLLRKAGYPILSVEPNRMQPEYCNVNFIYGKRTSNREF